MHHAATLPQGRPMRDLNESLSIWGTAGLGAYLLSFGQAVQTLVGVGVALVSIVQGYISIRRFLWDARDRRDSRARRPPV